MKSGLASIGAMHLSGAAQELETAAKGGDPALLHKTIDEALTAVRDYDADTGLAALEALLAYDFGEETDSLLENAAMAIKKYEYEKAIEVLEKATAK
ncbi:MAG: hypothetical protein LBI54_06295 [Lachnospiraceae bacterium]|jgi:HPt (histidine-containing phosphotransfer) domain-containing protein|nr:hypothetical protein [Lachnospiraceae bacterium]